MVKNKTLTLIVANSGTLQNGLLALITTLPQINTSMVAENVVSALKLIDVHQPTLIILDEDQLMAQDAVKQIHTKWPKIHIIVLVGDVARQREFKTLGADVVLVKGFPVQKLIQEIENILCKPENTPTLNDKDK